jgi:hypothetical protein
MTSRLHLYQFDHRHGDQVAAEIDPYAGHCVRPAASACVAVTVAVNTATIDRNSGQLFTVFRTKLGSLRFRPARAYLSGYLKQEATNPTAKSDAAGEGITAPPAAFCFLGVDGKERRWQMGSAIEEAALTVRIALQSWHHTARLALLLVVGAGAVSLVIREMPAAQAT